MDQISSEEIISILAMHGRPDLIQEFKEHMKVDEDYIPPLRARKDSLSLSEGSAASEEEYEIDEDDEGFKSLK
tara:strand:+ start:735 stop:953 length:219 start_codon:yes stop_codon:yes gene_type:complete